jgi:hypothetical protein
MTITANQVESSNTLEQFRQEFNKLQSDVLGLESGTITLNVSSTLSSNTTILTINETGTIVFEGATDNAYQTTLTVVDPTAARTITLPDSSGDVVLSNSGTVTSENIVANTAFLPDTSDGASLGTTSYEFSDLFLADGGQILFGDDQDVTLTHVADTGILLNGSSKIQFTNAAESIHSDGSKLILTSNSVAFSLPTADGSSGQTLVTNGGGVLSFANASANTPTSADGQALGSASLEWSDLFLADGGTVTFGNDQDVTLTHVHNEGLTLTHTATTDNTPIVFQLKSEENTLGTNEVIASIEFAAGDSDGGDSATVAAGIHAIVEGAFTSSANPTKLVFTTGVSESAAVVNGAGATHKMTLSSAGLLTIADDFIIKDAGTIGSASATTAITIASTGIVTLVDDLVLKDAATIGVTSSTSAISIASTGIVTFVDDILIKNAGTIGSANDPDAIAIGSDGDVTLTQDLELQHDGAKLSFGANDEVSLTHVHDTGLVLNTTKALQFYGSNNSIAAVASAQLAITSAVMDFISSVGQTNTTPYHWFKTDAMILYFGANFEVQLRHDHNKGLTLSHGSGDNTPVVFQLKSAEGTITSAEVIASLEFAAGDASGGDAATVAAGIHAIAEETFYSSANPTSLVFTTGVSETAAASATAKMTLTSGGNLNVVGELEMRGESIEAFIWAIS